MRIESLVHCPKANTISGWYCLSISGTRFDTALNSTGNSNLIDSKSLVVFLKESTSDQDEFILYS
jgi:hypothetical protein